ncbi:MAG: hypothetical protein ACRD0U_13030 [Acidimicrobiales bacterium]
MAAIAFVVLLGACGGDDDDASTTTTEPNSTTTTGATTTTGSTTTTTPQAAIDAEVTAAYEAAAQAFIAAAAIPDPDFPALLATHVDPMLNQRRGVLTQLKFGGRVIRYPANPQHRNEVESVDVRSPDIAVLIVCTVDDGERYDVATGALLTDGLPGTVRIEAALRHIEGSWRLAERLEQESWEGVDGCAID